MPGMKGGELRLKGDIEPNHVLVFERTPHDQPADGGAVFLNRMPGTATTNIRSKEQRMAEETKKPEKSEKSIEDKVAELERQVEVMKAVSVEKDEVIAEKEKALKAQAALKAKEEWDALAKELPRALVHGTKEIESRERFGANPAVFMKDVLVMVREQHAEALKEAGKEAGKAKLPEKTQKLPLTGITFNGVPVTE